MTRTVNIEISDEAKEKILKKGTVATLSIMEYHGCTGTYLAAAATLMKPFEIDNFDLFNVDGIDIYVQKETEIAPEGIQVSISKSWMTAQQEDNFKVSGFIIDQPMM